MWLLLHHTVCAPRRRVVRGRFCARALCVEISREAVPSGRMCPKVRYRWYVVCSSGTTLPIAQRM